jgi:hypothetical protein
MFTYQAVRRSDLRSPVSSRHSSPDLSDTLRSRFLEGITFTPQDISPQGHFSAELEEAAKTDDDEAELVLFAAPPSAAPRSSKIRLQSPEVDAAPGFLVPRPRSYYFAEEDREKRCQFELSAIDAETIRAVAKEPWPGCALPWKVRKLPSAGMQRIVLVPHQEIGAGSRDQPKKRVRKGKQSRIKMRKQLRARAEKEAEEQKLKQAKEEAEREKKIRKNRERNLKRKRAKEKARHVSEDAVEAVLDADERTVALHDGPSQMEEGDV